MNAKMDSGPLLHHIRRCFLIKTSLTLYSGRRLFTLIQNYQLSVNSKIIFTQNSYHIKTSQLICNANQLAGLCMVQVFIEGHFEKD